MEQCSGGLGPLLLTWINLVSSLNKYNHMASKANGTILEDFSKSNQQFFKSIHQNTLLRNSQGYVYGIWRYKVLSIKVISELKKTFEGKNLGVKNRNKGKQ